MVHKYYKFQYDPFYVIINGYAYGVQILINQLYQTNIILQNVLI